MYCPIRMEIAGLSKQAELIGGGVFFGGFGAYVFRLLPVEQSLCIQLFEALGNGGQLLDVLEKHLLDGWSAQAGRRMVERNVGAAIGEFRLSVNGGNLRSGKEARQREAAERDDDARDRWRQVGGLGSRCRRRFRPAGDRGCRADGT